MHSFNILLSQKTEDGADITESERVDTLSTYVYLLKIHQAIAPCDNSLKNFVMQDLSISPQELSLKVRPSSMFDAITHAEPAVDKFTAKHVWIFPLYL